MTGGDHYLVIRAVRIMLRTPIARVREEVARVSCQIVPLTDEVANTAMFTSRLPDGTSKLTQLRIRGKTRGHITLG